MIVLTENDAPLSKKQSDLNKPVALTIGNFDGVHRGHQKLLNLARSLGSTLVVVTFQNHPSEFFQKASSTPLLSTVETKLHLLEKHAVDITYLLEFDEKLTALTYQEFLIQLKEKFQFSHLILGEDASFGKNREGTKANVLEFAKCQNFEAHYVNLLKASQENILITSTQIRKLILSGNVNSAIHFLGHSLIVPISKISKIDSNTFKISPTRNFISLPDGIYEGLLNHEKVTLEIQNSKYFIKNTLHSNLSSKMLKIVSRTASS